MLDWLEGVEGFKVIALLFAAIAGIVVGRRFEPKRPSRAFAALEFALAGAVIFFLPNLGILAVLRDLFGATSAEPILLQGVQKQVIFEVPILCLAFIALQVSGKNIFRR